MYKNYVPKDESKLNLTIYYYFLLLLPLDLNVKEEEGKNQAFSIIHMTHMTIITDNDGNYSQEKDINVNTKKEIIKCINSNPIEKCDKDTNEKEKTEKKDNQSIIEKARYMELYITTTFTVFLDCLYKNLDKAELMKICEYAVSFEKYNNILN
jgi:hypothetical protein